ncbi:MAG: winged helix-turn-helix transcriptional regulator, partial [Candidatus Diapherotrites archaeon]|nr:winged helix-turn-helix transcriptional regulator [Candidatus Diapherotrites archaeon]
MDLKDWKILLELDLDSRQSLQSIGKKVGLSKEVVNYRIKKLLEEGIITNFFTRIDSSKIGVLAFRTFLRLYNLTPDKERDLIDYILANEKV